jgi:hypothetical protein
MKKAIKTIILFLFITIVNPSHSQTDPPGMPGNYGGGNDEVPGGGAPIGGGILILISMSAAYLIKKSDLSFGSSSKES